MTKPPGFPTTTQNPPTTMPSSTNPAASGAPNVPHTGIPTPVAAPVSSSSAGGTASTPHGMGTPRLGSSEPASPAGMQPSSAANNNSNNPPPLGVGMSASGLSGPSAPGTQPTAQVGSSNSTVAMEVDGEDTNQSAQSGASSSMKQMADMTVK